MLSCVSLSAASFALTASSEYAMSRIGPHYAIYSCGRYIDSIAGLTCAACMCLQLAGVDVLMEALCSLHARAQELARARVSSWSWLPET
jgi:hypothetical protein